ncbi:LINE-1 retrotransposable element ORF2 protein [Cucumis melo var. makuwa]|uniref:LINE-1 retrotransposable element ORF2 protein n=1 Tax=Cucumis melo var. makuwa TaxID=1194695 RepID=A0A5A7UTI6_CUCMM|nr:LINE-1 retrotransposable element ORF2 protein [Cucumis melo var. makuwa]TYJ99342.1 LINE-1 retrotransposable element ORF2 protein [Cucumis melo var. makuwa]
MSFSNEKAPGPDGYTMLFYKKHWPDLKDDLLNVFKDFHKTGIVNNNVNNTFIALISKKEKCSKPSDYRPISLTTSLYKLMAKALANRLKSALPDTIAENQMAFIKGRQINDAILIANEAIDTWKQRKIKGFVLKLDLEKAFDKISWSFIDFMLAKKHFPHKWRKWIKACISNVQYSILLNGAPKGRIKAERGIRQGDPLSPFIFVLAMDYLSRLLSHLESKGAIKGVSFNNYCNISHLLFADDVLIFVEDNERYLNNLQMALTLFEKASGLTFNNSKSTISPINISAGRTDQIASFFGFQTKFLPVNYLGVPLGGNPRSRSFWSQTIECIHKKLNGWKYSQISKGGRLTLLKASLSSLPTYQLSTFKAPVSVYKEIEKHWRDFLWGGSEDKQNAHLINWNICTSPKELGGLGISKVKDTNQALLCKWLWRYHNESNSLWKKCIDAKYTKNHQGDIPVVGRNSSANSPWNAIKKWKDWYESKISWMANDGSSLSFWHSKWHNNIPLSLQFPRLYALSNMQSATVKEIWDQGSDDWNMEPRRPLNEREQQTWDSIKMSLPRIHNNRGMCKPSWNPSDSKKYTVASAKDIAFKESSIPKETNWEKELKHLWRSHIPQKCKFFIWTMVHQKLNTMDKIQKRNPSMSLNPSWCISCRSSNEDMNHLFIFCPFARNLWNMWSSETGTPMATTNVKDLCLQLCRQSDRNTKNIISFNSAIATLWTIWIRRNNLIFADKDSSYLNAWEDICTLTGSWSSKSKTLKNYSQATIALNIKALCNLPM